MPVQIANGIEPSNRLPVLKVRNNGISYKIGRVQVRERETDVFKSGIIPNT